MESIELLLESIGKPLEPVLKPLEHARETTGPWKVFQNPLWESIVILRESLGDPLN